MDQHPPTGSPQGKIKIHPHGPYEVSGGIPLACAYIGVDKAGDSTEWEPGKAYPEQDGPYLLCRCGHSADKPYCDGAHADMGFAGDETAPHSHVADGAVHYPGQQVDLLDIESLCASLRFCVRGIGVWDAVEGSADPDKLALAVQQAQACAAGRLVLLDKAGQPLEPALPMSIGLVEDTAAHRRGPLAVQGGVPLEGADGTPYETRNRMTLCRCGESANMPFCDISHMRCAHMEGFDVSR